MILMGQATARHPDLFLFIIGLVTLLFVMANFNNWLKSFDTWLYKRLGGLWGAAIVANFTVFGKAFSFTNGANISASHDGKLGFLLDKYLSVQPETLFNEPLKKDFLKLRQGHKNHKRH